MSSNNDVNRFGGGGEGAAGARAPFKDHQISKYKKDIVVDTFHSFFASAPLP